ncbi:hypothetical protein CRYUN_Cryun24cG0127900 [Craigia yunnanensis]
MVERTVRSENYGLPNRPIYLVGESIGTCLALAVAARNPEIDLVLILANPATSFSKSQLQHLMPLLEIIPGHFPLNFPYMMSLMKVEEINCCPVKRKVKDFRMLCRNVRFEDGVDLVMTIKGASFYRRGKQLDCGSDYIPPTPSEFKKLYESLSYSDKPLLPFPKEKIRGIDQNLSLGSTCILNLCAFGAINLTLAHYRNYENGKEVRGLVEIPSEGPVVFVGYHMLMAIEVVPFVAQLMIERDSFASTGTSINVFKS